MPRREWAVRGVVGGLLALAFLMARDPWTPSRPQPTQDYAVPRGGVRQVPEQLAFEGDKCGECHTADDPPTDTGTYGEYHEVKVEHGPEQRCFDCHHRQQMDALTGPDGKPMALSEAPRLCGKCHGPTLRDWNHGEHGRRNGYWNPAAGPQEKLSCLACHDPHKPHFAPLKPAPGPKGAP